MREATAIDGTRPESMGKIRNLFPNRDSMKTSYGTAMVALLTALMILSSTGTGLALDRSTLLFYSSLDGDANADFARGRGEVHEAYAAAFTPGVRGKAAIVGRDTGLIETLAAPVPFWLDVALSADYGNKDIGALRYEQKDNLNWREGTLSFWVQPLDWQGGNINRYLAHFDMLDTLSFVWVPYPNWIEYRQARISNRDIYRKFPSRVGVPQRDIWQNITVAWRENEQRMFVDGVEFGAVSDGVPGYPGGGKHIAFGAANDYNTAFDEILVLAQAVDATGAKALYNRVKVDGGESLLTIPRTTAAVEIDGKIDEAEYAHAARLRGWNDAILGVANDDPTSACLTYDKENLYVAFVFPTPETYRANPVLYVNQPIKMTTRTANDPQLFSDDCFEVIVSPSGTGDTYRLAVNGAGYRYDAKNGDVSWNGNWKFQSYFDDEMWVVEMALPFSMFGRAMPEKGETWRANLRHRAAQVIEMDSVWAFCGARPTDMMTGLWRFGDAAPAVRYIDIANPASGQVGIEFEIGAALLNSATKLSLDTKVVTTCYAELNPDGPKAMKDRDPNPPEGFNDLQKIALVPGAVATAKVRHALPASVAAELLVTVKDADGEALWRQRLPFAFSRQTATTVRMLPSEQQLIVEIDCGSSALVESGISASVAISDSNGNVVKKVQGIKIENVRQQVNIDKTGLAAGEYTASTALTADGQQLAEMQTEFIIEPKPEWFGTKVGVGDDVLAPWTPLETDGNTISCWGRTYDYKDSLYPAAVNILGEQLLASPIILSVKEKGVSRPVANAVMEFGSIKPNRIEYQLSGSAGSFDFVTDNWIEYDGLIWTKLIVRPREAGATIDELVLEFPFNPAIATHWFDGQYRPDGPTGYLPRENFRYEARSGIRIGDAERGLQWCWEHRHSWRIANPGEALELLPQEDRYLARLKLVDHTITVDQPIEIEIGLMGLPCRPSPRGFRGPHWGVDLGIDSFATEIGKQIPLVSLATRGIWYYWNTPKLTEEQLQRGRETLKRHWLQRNLTGCIYSNHLYVCPLSPEFRYYYEEWRAAPSGEPNFKMLEALPIEKARWNYSGSVCYGSETYTDFYLYYLEQSLRRFHGDNPKVPIGLYFDCTRPATCNNKNHGCGFTVDDEHRPTQAILAWRRASERIRRVIKSIDPDTSWLTVHMSGDPLMAVWSFYDVMIPGEQYVAFANLKKGQAEAAGRQFPDNYTQLCELDRVRAEYSNQGYGPAQLFLSFTRMWADLRNPNVATDRHLFGLMFVNDIMTWRSFPGKAPVLEALWQHFGWDDEVVFHPYWRNQRYLNMEPYDENKIVASIFERKGKICIFAFNNTDASVNARFDLNLEPLGVRGYENGILVEPISKKEYALSGTKAEVVLPKRDYQLFFLQPPSKK